jgi:hypothetical protein
VSLTIYTDEEKRGRDFLALYRWQWLKQLMAERMTDLHAEIYEHFGKNP